MSVIKKVLFFGCILAGAFAVGMHRSLELHDNLYNNQNISYKSLKGLPLVRLSKGTMWYCALSDGEKNEVHEQIVQQQDERLLTLFNVVRMIPLDAQKIIGKKLFGADAVDEFLNLSVAQAYCYEGFLDIINNKKFSWLREHCSEDSHFRPDIICSLFKEMALVNKYCVDFVRPCANREHLESFNKLATVFHDSLSTMNSPITYRFHSLPTLSNITKKFMHRQVYDLPLLLSTFIILALPSAFYKSVNPDNIKFNALASDFNRQAVRLYKETDCVDFLQARVAIRPEFYIKMNRFALIKFLFFALSVVPILSRDKSNNPASMVFSLLTQSCFFIAICKAMSYMSFPGQENLFVEFSVAALVYIYMCCCYNRTTLNSLKHGLIRLHGLPALLERKDILIR